MVPDSQQKSRRQSGETRIWLTSLGLLTGLIMVLCLLVLVLWQGLVVFWPKPVHEFALKPTGEGTQPVILLAEIAREQTRKLPGDTTEKHELQLFLGNREVFGQAFRFVEEPAIAHHAPAAGVIVAERLEYGDLIGHPVAIEAAGGTPVKAGTPEFRTLLENKVAAANALAREIKRLETREIGALSREVKDLETAKITASRELSDPAALAARHAELDAAIKEKQAPIAALIDKAGELRKSQQADTFIYRLADGSEKRMPLANIVHFHFPNEMDLRAKLGHFFHGIWSFLSQDPRESNTEGGIFPAIFGTFVMTLLMSALVTPLGVLAAIYLREYARQGTLVRGVRICVNNLAGVPSIVFGVFGVGFFLYGIGSFIDRGPESPMTNGWWLPLAAMATLVFFTGIWLAIKTSTPIRPIHPSAAITLSVATVAILWLIASCPYFHGFYTDSPEPVFGTGGILWASLTLALMTLPVVIVASEEALASVPRGAREAALACGASKWQTIQRVVLPSALPGIMTGVILSMARGAGEVAPLMLTGVVKLSPSLPVDGEFPFIHADRKFMHLGFHIYDLGFQSPDSDAARPMVFATTLFLILLVILMNIAAIRLRNWLRDKYKASTF